MVPEPDENSNILVCFACGEQFPDPNQVLNHVCPVPDWMVMMDINHIETEWDIAAAASASAAAAPIHIPMGAASISATTASQAHGEILFPCPDCGSPCPTEEIRENHVCDERRAKTDQIKADLRKIIGDFS